MNRKKRMAVIIGIMVIISLSLTLTVSAAVDPEGGFSLWNLLDGLGGFFRDLINSIGKFLSNVISAIKNGINAVLDGLSKIWRAISSATAVLLDGIKRLFIPSKEYLSNFRDEILSKFDKKFGSVFSALDYLKRRFTGLKAKEDLRDTFKVTFPKNSFMYGLTVDWLSTASPVLAFIRLVLTGLCCLETALICYHKVIEMVSK